MALFDKAKTPAKPRKKWWILHTKNYSYYIWALPILPFVLLADYIKDRNYKRLVWDETIATKVLDKVLPQILEWVEEDNAFYYSMEWSTSSLCGALLASTANGQTNLLSNCKTLWLLATKMPTTSKPPKKIIMVNVG